MDLNKHIAKHFYDVHFGGNWTVSGVRDALSGVNWEQATTKIYGLNTIAMLAFHINYFVAAVVNVLEGNPLDAHDKYSYTHPPINSEPDWQQLVAKILSDAEKMTALIQELPESKLWEYFSDERYGSYYRNLHGVIEHTHYHLGQIVVIKKIILSGNGN